MHSLSIKFRITALALLVTTVPLIITLIISTERTSATLMQFYKEHLEQRSMQIAEEVDRYLQQRITDIVTLSKAGELYSNNDFLIQRYINNIKNAHPFILDVMLLNKDGKILNSIDQKLRDRLIWEFYLGVKELFASALNSTNESVYVSEASVINRDPTIILLTPLVDPETSKIFGILLFKVNLSQTNKILAAYNEREKPGANTYIVDKLGNIIMSTSREMRQYSRFSDVMLQPAMLSNNSHGVLQYVNEKQVEILAGYSDMPEFGKNLALDWSVISVFPVERIIESENQTRNLLLVVSLALTALVVLIAYLFARGIALPLQRIAVIAQEICKGDYSHRLESHMGGEIGALSTAINEMADRIDERTAEIVNRNEKLTSEITERTLAEERLKQLSHKIIRLQEEERQRVSRELHDGINQLLVSVKYKLENYVDNCNKPDGRTDTRSFQDIRNAVVFLEDAIAEVRRISHDLRPSILDDFGLSAAIKNSARQFQERNQIDVEIEGIDDDILTRMPVDVETALYRIVQEGLMNIEKYANATKVVINMTHTAINVTIRIEDNGSGFDLQKAMRKPGSSSGGMGLRNMRERIELLQGSFFIHSEEGRGTFIEVDAPLNLE